MSKTRALDIFSVLRRLDMGDKTVYRSFEKDAAAKKELDTFLGFPALRFMSAAEGSADDQRFCLESTNEFVNSGYFALGNHKELQAKVLAVSGSRKRQRHPWIAGPTRKDSSLARKVVMEMYPHYKDDEVKLWISLNSTEDILDLAGRIGWSREEINKLKDQL